MAAVHRKSLMESISFAVSEVCRKYIHKDISIVSVEGMLGLQFEDDHALLFSINEARTHTLNEEVKSSLLAETRTGSADGNDPTRTDSCDTEDNFTPGHANSSFQRDDENLNIPVRVKQEVMDDTESGLSTDINVMKASDDAGLQDMFLYSPSTYPMHSGDNNFDGEVAEEGSSSPLAHHGLAAYQNTLYDDASIESTSQTRTLTRSATPVTQRGPSSTPRSGPVWTAAREELLVVLWENEENLYNSRSELYRDARERTNSMARIAASLEIPVTDVERHMKSLRTVYSKVSHLPPGRASFRLRPRDHRVLKLCKFLYPFIQKRENNSRSRKAKTAPSTSEPNDEEDQRKTARSPSPSGKRSSSVPNISAVKRRQQTTMDSDEDSVASSSFSGASRNVKRKRDEEVSVEMARSASSMTKFEIDKLSGKGSESLNPHMEWSRLLALKLEKMVKKVAERFKVHVDSLALDAIDGNWP